MNHRFQLQKDILDHGRFFKLICGAGNEDAGEVYRLTLVYALAGALGVDVSANPHVVASAKRAVEEAKRLARSFGQREYINPYITVSVGMPGDPHVRKAQIIADKCTHCNACIPVCPTDAIPQELVIIRERCIGCGACAVACQDDAVAYAHNVIDMENVLHACLDAGAENIELHANVLDHPPCLEEWKLITRLLPDSFVSLCTDRGYLSNHELIKRIKMMLDLAEGRMIVQADGIPMSGGRDDYNTTLQAVATADIVAKSQLPVYILVSGGTNSMTMELADICGVPCAGVSIGTFARHQVYPYINHPDFPQAGLLNEAVGVAKRLVATCL
jgi:Fe-S-cluster-containing hydrogenase component 2